MENKEIKNIAAEMTDEEMEQVSGGNQLQWSPATIINDNSTLDPLVVFNCPDCGKLCRFAKSVYNQFIATRALLRDPNGLIYCTECSKKRYPGRGSM